MGAASCAVRRRSQDLSEPLLLPLALSSGSGLAVSSSAAPPINVPLQAAEYLPFQIQGKTILVRRDDGYLVDNSLLKTESVGCAFRSSKNLEDKTNNIALWGAIVHGIEEWSDDGVKWLKVDDAQGPPPTPEEVAVAIPVQRQCQVCYENLINTVLLPCRHSVLCLDCATTVRQQGNGKCPICRAAIDIVRVGEYDSDFVSFADVIVTKAGKRLGQTAEHMFEGMYEHIKFLLLTGLLFLVTSIVCFLMLLLPLGVAFAIASFCIGYIPWFLVTVQGFENRGREAGPRDMICSREDCGQPHILLLKIIVLIVLLPLALVLFLLPYCLYALVLRPFVRSATPCILRAFLRLLVDVFWYSWMGISMSLRCLRNCFKAVGTYVLSPIAKACVWSYQHVLVPIAEGIARGARFSAQFGYANILLPCYNVAAIVAQLMHNYVLAPLQTCVTWTVQVVSRCCESAKQAMFRCCDRCKTAVITAAKFMYYRVLTPIVQRTIAFASACSEFAIAAARAFYSYALVPLGDCIAVFCKAVRSCITFVLKAVFDYALVPIGKCIGYVCVKFCNCLYYSGQKCMQCLTKSAVLFYSYVLYPIAAVIYAIGKCIGYVCARICECLYYSGQKCLQCVTKSAVLFYTYVLHPVGYGFAVVIYVIGMGLKKGVQKIVAIGKEVASFLYRNIIAPLGHGLSVCLQSLASGIATVASFMYRNIVAPVGEGMKRMVAFIMGVGSAIASAISSILQSVCQVVYSIVLLLSSMVQALLRVVQSMALSLASMVKAVGRSVSDAFQKILGF